MKCLPCKMTFAESENYEKHLQSEEHKQKLFNVQEREDHLPDESQTVALSSSKYDGTIKCPVCDLSFNSLESFQNHSATPEHALKIMQKQAISNASSNLNTSMTNHEVNGMKYEIEINNKESILPELNNDKSSLFSYGKCDICSKIFSGPEPYKQHMESKAHKKKVDLQKFSTNFEGNGTLKCEPCKKSFSGQVPYAQHMSSEIHKKTLQNFQALQNYLSKMNSSDSQTEIKENVGMRVDLNKSFFCEICNKECSGFIPYQQHLEGSTHFKNARRAQSLNSAMTSLAQLQIGKISEEFESVNHTVNGSCGRDNSSVFSEKERDLKVVTTDELGELVKVFSPDEKINFDKVDQLEDLENEVHNENQNNEKFSTVKNNAENGFNDNLKKTEKENKYEIYETCKFCNVSLFDKESTVEHFESKEHYEKRWGHKM